MLSLDEAIRHAEEVYKDMSSKAKFFNDPQNSIYDMGRGDDCLECAEEYRQLAEWLQDYKRLLTQTHEPVSISDTLPSVSQTKKGHWIEEDMFDGDVAYRCSACNELFCIIEGTPKDNEYNFCPKCGSYNGGE